VTTTRCAWAGTDPLYIEYHDREWGVPAHDERHLFEMLVLEGAQAGLAWITILRKRAAYRKAFAGFDPKKVARFDARARARLLADSGIVRNRAKIDAAIVNAKKLLEVQDEFGTFDRWIWSFVEGAPIVNRWKTLSAIPPQTPESKAMSAALRKRGFKFVGPTICYAFMQAVGMVNDHVVTCFRHRQLTTARAPGTGRSTRRG
jgi:DNA-3-methyladenine glycosylase I